MINSSIIGANLKKLIKDRDFTQEEFAEITGIGLSTLKKYISGKVFYSIDTLELFADRLQCSYDYLLGKSLSPEPELKDIKEATRLQDGALERLLEYAKHYDDDPMSRRYIETISTLIQSNSVIGRISDYFYVDSNEEVLCDPTLQPGIFVGNEYLGVPDIEKVNFYSAIEALCNAKSDLHYNIPFTRRNFKNRKE